MLWFEGAAGTLVGKTKGWKCVGLIKLYVQLILWSIMRLHTWAHGEWLYSCTHTHTHTEQIELCMWSISVSLPHCESLAIPDAGWSAEPAWPETIRDPRGGCTSQWALRPWLKHQLLSMQRWREEKEREGRDHKKDEGIESLALSAVYVNG